MSKAKDLIEYNQSDDDFRHLKGVLYGIRNDYFRAIEETMMDLADEDIKELTEYLRFFERKHGKEKLSNDVSMNKIKAFFLLFSKLSDDENADKILTYLESMETGWHDGIYYLNNTCLCQHLNGPLGHCKNVSEISDTESAYIGLSNVYDIFFNDEFSPITLFVFNYCLASIYSSILNEEGFPAPYFLQIAINKTSVAYQVLKEIMEICDVNSGLYTNCQSDVYEYMQCGYVHQIFYPTQSVTKDINELIKNFKDSPVLIVGHENERNYTFLLREIANITKKKKALDLRDKFNMLPVFVCPEIKSSFDNVFDMDLTDLETSNEYLKLIRKEKRTLASWVLKLVTHTDRKQYQRKEEIHKLYGITAHNTISHEINSYTNKCCQKYDHLTLENAKNVGFLNFFFKKFLDTFQRLCTFPKDEKFACFETKDGEIKKNIKETVDMIAGYSELSLVRLHHRYLPAPTGTGIKNRDAVGLARQIEKHYRALKVYVRVIPSEVKKDRYIFTLDTLNGTKDIDVSKNATTVQRRLKKYEYFRLDLRDMRSIRLVVAEQPLTDNSLIQILKHEDFTESRLKIPYAVGFDDTGNMCIADIADLPHLLFGGASNSGKSTAIMSLLMSVAYKHRSGNVNVLILDLLGKEKSDFDVFNGQHFLSAPVITDPDIGRKAILSLYKEKIRRLKDRDLPIMPHIICVIDEFPRLYSDDTKKEDADKVKAAMNDLLSSGRHANIHLVLAVQNPVKEDMKGSIANITARIALRCAHYQNSKTILGRAGAEKLIGRGQMIYDSLSERDKILQGSYISHKDIKILLAEIKETFVQQNRYPFRLNDLENTSIPVGSDDNGYGVSKRVHGKSDEDILLEAVMWSLPQEKISNSRLQNECKIGNNRANRALDRMKDMGLIYALNGNLGWKVIPGCFEEMPVKALNYLKENGIAESKIRDLFPKKVQETNVQNREIEDLD